MKISILYHLYDDYSTLQESITSILNQDNKNFELILIHDSPSDNVVEIVDSFKLLKDKRVKVIKFMENFGRSFTYNFALEKAKGDYVYFAESKTILEPNFVSELLSIANNKAKKYDYINFFVNNVDEVAKHLPQEMVKGGQDEIANIVNIKLTLKDKIFRKKFLLDNKIEFAQYKNFHSLYIYNILENYNSAYYSDKVLAKWRKDNKIGYKYNLYNILESAELLCDILKKKNDDNEDKIDAYLTWIPICMLYEFVKKMYSSYYNNEKVVAKAIDNAASLIERVYPNYKFNKKLELLDRKLILNYVKDFKRNLSYVRKNLKQVA